MKLSESERQADDLALARYSVIAPLVCQQLGAAERVEMRRRLVDTVHVFPDGSRKVSTRCLERWLSWYCHGHEDDRGEIVTPPGIEALRPLPRHDKGVPRVLDDATVERAVALRREDPTRNTAGLIELLQAEARKDGLVQPCINEATLAYHLRQRKATKSDLKREGKAFRRYQQSRRNVTWQADFSQGLMIPDPVRPGKLRLCHLHALIDDRTRYVPHAEFYFHQNLPCLEDCFRKAILKGGVPEQVYWDNGKVYQSRQIQTVAARLKTRVIFATPYAPEGKGKVERFFRTVKDSFYVEARNARIESLGQLNEFFWAWLERRYHDRMHSEIECTPRSAWEAGKEHVRYPEPASMIDLFLWEERRRVDKSGCIHLCGNAYPVAEHLVGRTVEVRFDPFDLKRVRLYENRVCSQILEPQTLVSQTFRQAKPRKKEAPAGRDSSVNYRKQVSGELRAQVDQTVGKVRGAPTPFLSLHDFSSLLQSQLAGRILKPSEAGAVESWFTKNAPLTGSLVESALSQAAEVKGTRRHIRFYLDHIQAARMAEGKE